MTEKNIVLTNEETKKIIRKLSVVSIVGNFLLSVFKIFAGSIGNSGAMLSDAIHSISDVFTTLIAYLGVKISNRKPDKAHPYGHERLECVASLVLGIILLLVALGIGWQGLENIISGNYATLEIPSIIALIAAIVSIAAKEAMYWYTIYYAKKIHSDAFRADAWHHRSDAFSSVGSLLGIGGAMLGFTVLDSVASVVICLFILKVVYDILKDSLSKMLDTACSEEFEEELKEFILAQDGVDTIDRLHTRMFGSKVYVDLELSMDGGKTLKESHDIGMGVHFGVEEHFPNVKHVMIHINPATEKDQTI